MKNFRIIIVLLFLVSDGCVDELKVPVLVQRNLVVDGAITDEPGPYTVKLYLSSSIEEDLDRPEYVTGASVQIKDDLGNTEQLTEASDGIYTTDANGIQGEVGRKYQVLITTTDGNQYESSLAALTSAGEIETLDFTFEENVINPDDLSEPQDAVIVWIDARGTAGNPNLFRWRWTGTYRVRTFPELHEQALPDGGSVPDPLPCSGYIVDPEFGLMQVDTCSCCDCWLNQYSTSVLLSNNDFVEDDEFNHVQVAEIPFDKRLFYEKYHIEVEQISEPEDVYQFWKLVDSQEEGAGDIFQPNIVKVTGNIRCTTNPDEEVFGIFAVSAITKKSIFIHRNDIPKRLAPIDTSYSDCRDYAGATNIKPPFW